MFTPEARNRIRDHVVALARSDPRVTAAARTGSTAGGAEDAWSDIDLAFGIADDTNPMVVLDDWTDTFRRDLGALHDWDLPAGASLYRVFLLPDGLELDIGVTPQREFGPRGPHFQTLFGTSGPLTPPPSPDTRSLIGMSWHHVLHARACIERAKPWQAEYWISALRDHTLALACLRLGEPADYGRGLDRLPAPVTGPFADALVRSLETPELRRALAAATTCLIRELDAWDPALSARLGPLLRDYAAPDSLSPSP
ncbi:MAG TPA: hypothetical protein VIC85_13930 [Ktedonobacterales bacterium]|jgi:hypothetical protein